MNDSNEEQQAVESMRKQKQKYVENIAEESDMASEEEREIIRQALDEKIITEEFRNVQIEKDGIGTSILEDIRHTLGSKGASRSRGKISSVKVEESDIKITFTVVGTDDKFTKSYDIPQSDTIGGDLEDIFVLADTDANNPNELKGCTVPVKPSHYRKGIKYEIDKPSEQLGLTSRFVYRISRLLKRLELIRYNTVGIDDDSYTPTGRLYAVIISLILLSTQLETIGVILAMFLTHLLMFLAFSHASVENN